MNYASLESRAPAADALARTVLGTTISYVIGNAITALKVHSNLEDGTIRTGTSSGIRQDIEMMLLKSDLAVMPTSAHRIRCALLAGNVYQPVNVRSDDTGRHWLFELKQVAS